MKHSLLYFVLIAVLASCNKKLYEATQNPNIIVDGDPSEWNLSDLKRIPDENLLYAINQDQERIYVLIKSTDEQVSKKIQALGLTIWVDGKGKKNKRQGVTYPVGIAQNIVQKRIQSGRNGVRNNTQRNRSLLDDETVLQRISENSNTVELINFFDDTNKAFPFQLSELRIPIEAARKRANPGELIVEFAIPKNAIKKKKGKISMGIETGKLEFQRPGGRGAGNLRPGIARRRPGFRQGGRAFGQNPQRRAQFKELNDPIKHWEKVKIK